VQTLAAALVTLVAATALAQVGPDAPRDKAPRLLSPVLDVPLRDTAVTRAADGTYYLTGTACAGMSGKDSYLSDFKPDDFQNNDGVWLWRSKDMTNWEPLGQVWSIYKEIANSPSVFHATNKWQTDWNTLPGIPNSPRVRGMTAPELHQIKGTCYICYSMNSNGTGLLRSKTGKAEGPYEDLGRITHSGGDPSLFEDADGTVYWLWGDGWIAKMNDDLTALGEQPRRIAFEQDARPGETLLKAGQGGMFMFRADIPKKGRYHLVYYDYVPRMDHVPCKDTHISSAPTPYGPFSSRRSMIPHGGQVTVFQDGEGNFRSTFAGTDEWAAFRDKPGIVPLERGPGGHGAFQKPFYPVTVAGAWGDIEPFIDVPMRDVCVLNAPDDYYYLTGSQVYTDKPREEVGINIWRSKDMKKWEDMGMVWKCDDHPLSKAGLDSMIESCNGRTTPFIIFDTEMHYLKGTYWLLASQSCRKGRWWDDDGMLILLLRSKSGKPEGPYELHWQDQHDDRGRFWTPNLFQDDDGKCYLVGGGHGRNISLLKDDLTGVEKHLPAIMPQGGYLTGEGGHVQKIGDCYFFTTAASVGYRGRRGGIIEGPQMSTYDLRYSTAKSIHGPWSPTRAVPRCGNSRLFQDKQGRWWAPFFGGNAHGPWVSRPSAYPVEVKGDRIIPKR
jgi:beta-xylosidase